MTSTSSANISELVSTTASATASGTSDVQSCWGLSCSSQWEWARWVIFVMFMVILLTFIITTVRINYIRKRNGQQPLRYVSWLTPPAYRQSDSSRRRRTDVPVADYVPTYTAEANENDLGYYDSEGIFHVNSKAEPPPPIDAYVVDRRNDRNRNVDLEMQQVRPTAVDADSSRQPPLPAYNEQPPVAQMPSPEVPATTNQR
ncbi:unnamed protein product [Kluyveromyces dobzhanskii CBS 2104]|uniref:WGS project CCBQ000000000 data, contig 00008 n=1 Tax=Kluyveromyces dobzhanskii CBS 2104 TaxID=1427455 RepID=A0A0A8L738_9SACH|nr:unnamed protein product [Kluyveromyces dobzhanskii CBS 2104]